VLVEKLEQELSEHIRQVTKEKEADEGYSRETKDTNNRLISELKAILDPASPPLNQEKHQLLSNLLEECQSYLPLFRKLPSKRL